MNVILGFVLLVLLGYVGSHLSLFRSRLTFGLRYLFTAGTEFLIVGLVLGPHGIALLTNDSLKSLFPVISLGLGWIGFLIGVQFERGVAQRISRTLWSAGTTATLIAVSLLSLGLYACLPYLFIWLGEIGLLGLTLLQEDTMLIIGFILVMAAAGAVSTSSAMVLLVQETGLRSEFTKRVQLINEVRAPLAVFLMGLWYALYHVSSDPASTRYLENGLGAERTLLLSFEAPIMGPLGWLLISTLLGMALGWLLHYLTSERLQEKEMFLLLTGMVIISGGLSSYLHLSPLFVNLVMGVTLANLPNFARGRINNLLLKTEKPFFVIFMLLVGALWPWISPAVILFALIYVLLRAVVLYAVNFTIAKTHSMTSESPLLRSVAMLPMGGLSIALVVDYLLIRPGFFANFALSVILLAVLLNQLIGPPILALMMNASPQGQSTQQRVSAAKRKKEALRDAEVS